MCPPPNFLQSLILPDMSRLNLARGRFVNTYGDPGTTIPCDLHNEIVNQLFKEVINNISANLTEVASTWAAQVMTSLAHTTEI